MLTLCDYPDAGPSSSQLLVYANKIYLLAGFVNNLFVRLLLLRHILSEDQRQDVLIVLPDVGNI